MKSNINNKKINLKKKIKLNIKFILHKQRKKKKIIKKEKNHVLYIKKNKNNFFLTLYYFNNNNIIAQYTLKTKNLKKRFNTRKKRRTGDALKALINKFLKIIKKKYTKKLHILKIEAEGKNLNIKIKWIFWNRIKIKHIIYISKPAHNGMKLKKKKRK